MASTDGTPTPGSSSAGAPNSASGLGQPVAVQSPQLQSTSGSTASPVQVGGLGSSLPSGVGGAMIGNQSFVTFQQQSAMYQQKLQQQHQQQLRNNRLMVPQTPTRASGARPSGAATANMYTSQQQQQAQVPSSTPSLQQQQMRMQQRPPQISTQPGTGLTTATRSPMYPAPQPNMGVQYMQQGMRAMTQGQVPVHQSMLNGAQATGMQARQTINQGGAMQMMRLPGQRGQSSLRPQQTPQQIPQQQLNAAQRLPVNQVARPYQVQPAMQQQWTKSTIPPQFHARPGLTNQQYLQQQQQLRVQQLAGQRPTLPSPGAPANQAPEPTNRILGKRTIQDLVGQIDPKERLEPDVEDVLLDIADDFIETVTSFACQLAKHRKSTVLEAKDVLLHLERSYNITLPGFGGDDYKPYKKPALSETHKQRLAAVKKSQASPEIKAPAAGTKAPIPTSAPAPRTG